MGRPSLCGNCGECVRCDRAAYMREWYRRPGNAQAQRDSQSASRSRRIETIRAYDRARGNRTDPEVNKTRCKTFRLFPEAQPCEAEGCDARGERHHDDYSKPDQIRWLCKAHHMAYHRVVA